VRLLFFSNNSAKDDLVRVNGNLRESSFLVSFLGFEVEKPVHIIYQPDLTLLAEN